METWGLLFRIKNTPYYEEESERRSCRSGLGYRLRRKTLFAYRLHYKSRRAVGYNGVRKNSKLILLAKIKVNRRVLLFFLRTG